MLSEIVTPVPVGAWGPTPWALPVVLTYFGVIPSRWDVGGSADDDAYLLVLLADQEFVSGREEQAQSLLDAAYAAFDQTTGDEATGHE